MFPRPSLRVSVSLCIFKRKPRTINSNRHPCSPVSRSFIFSSFFFVVFFSLKICFFAYSPSLSRAFHSCLEGDFSEATCLAHGVRKNRSSQKTISSLSRESGGGCVDRSRVTIFGQFASQQTHTQTQT